EARVVVDVVQVIHDDDQPPPRVAAAQPAEGLEEIGDTLAAAEDAAQAVAVDVVEAEEVAHALEPAVGRPHPPWVARCRPGGPPAPPGRPRGGGAAPRGPLRQKRSPAGRGGPRVKGRGMVFFPGRAGSQATSPPPGPAGPPPPPRAATAAPIRRRTAGSSRA